MRLFLLFRFYNINEIEDFCVKKDIKNKKLFWKHTIIQLTFSSSSRKHVKKAVKIRKAPKVM